MLFVVAAVVILLSTICTAAAPQYLPTIKQRWDASDLVCTGIAQSPKRTGITREIDNRDRDQLSAQVTIEKCFKGRKPQTPTISVTGYSLYATKELDHRGILYSGPPVGFLSQGRNLLFLRHTGTPRHFEIAVPIYETAIRLADSRPYYRDDDSPIGVRFALTQEFEAALLQFPAADSIYIGWIFDLLGTDEAVAELRRFSPRAPAATRPDIAVSLLNHGEMDFEPLVIALLQDASAPVWKRQNAARALGDHGSQRALPYLRELAAEPAASDESKTLRVWALDALKRLECRLANCH